MAQYVPLPASPSHPFARMPSPSFPCMQPACLLPPPCDTPRPMPRGRVAHPHYHPLAPVCFTSDDHAAHGNCRFLNLIWVDLITDLSTATGVLNFRLGLLICKCSLEGTHVTVLCVHIPPTSSVLAVGVTVSYTPSCEDAPQLSSECALQIRKVKSIWSQVLQEIRY